MGEGAGPIANAAAAEPARCVLDTNVVLDLVIFGDPRVAWLARAIRDGSVAPVTSPACMQELQRVLAYPRLRLDVGARLAATERYGAQARIVDCASAVPAALPACSDPQDQKFLDLAWHARARWLLTRDKALLGLARAAARAGRFTIALPWESALCAAR